MEISFHTTDIIQKQPYYGEYTLFILNYQEHESFMWLGLENLGNGPEDQGNASEKYTGKMNSTIFESNQ